MACHGQAPGFFGKLPSHGDFVGRRLPPEVRQCLDEWLQIALVQSRVDLGGGWLPTWLNSPIWRFVLGAGVCNRQAWAGIMMPSQDRVGRCFPLLLATGIDGTPLLRDCLTLDADWFERLEELALSALDEGFSLEAFDVALLGLGSGAPVAAAAGTAPPDLSVPYTEVRTDLASSVLAGASFDGCSTWWTLGSPRVPACLAFHRGLPAPGLYGALLDGQWSERGWHAE